MIEWLNKIYCIDNLELLKQLPDECIDLIYCDILYNTGKRFNDFNDNLGTPQQAIEWYRPRLIEMKRVLKETGSIYLQCDYRLVHYLKIEMDDVFGLSNFRNEIIWNYGGASPTKSNFARKHDTILFYSKTNNYKFNPVYGDKLPEYLYKRARKDSDGRLWVDQNLGKLNEDTINKMKAEGKVFTTLSGKLRRKQYLDEMPGEQLNDTWNDIPIINSQAKERVSYNTQKPKKLLERIVKASSNEGDVVADFFCGSGTSLVVAKELGRNYIGCDINPRAVEITNKRLNDIKLSKQQRLF